MELLVVLVILAVTVAVGLPAYLAQVSTTRVNAANAAVMATAKACAVAQVTDNFDSNFSTPMPAWLVAVVTPASTELQILRQPV